MTSAEARDILISFEQTFLSGLHGEYYMKLKEAIKTLYDESYYAEMGAQPPSQCNPTCGCSQ